MELIAGPIKGYKAFSPDLTCRGFQFQIGQTYELPSGEEPVPCKRGFHFCLVPIHCNHYYHKSYKPRYAEIEAWDVINDGDKSVARKILIVREISLDEWESLEGRFEGNRKTYYIKRGKIHREDGPAIEYADGRGITKEWYIRGLRHREDGPAFEYANGDKVWYQYNNIHRKDGPAFERGDGYKEWWENGICFRCYRPPDW